MNAALSPARLLAFVAGFVLWHLALIVLYAALTIGCEQGWNGSAHGPFNLQRAVLIGLWIAHLLAIALFLGRVWRRRAAPAGPRLTRFVSAVEMGVTIWSLAAAILIGMPLFGASMCV